MNSTNSNFNKTKIYEDTIKNIKDNGNDIDNKISKINTNNVNNTNNTNINKINSLNNKE